MQNIAKPSTKDVLAENVKSLMGGFSQNLLKAAAQKTGISARTLAYIVSKGESNPRLETLIQLARGYRISVIELLSKDLGKASTAGAQKAAEPDSQPYFSPDPVIQNTVENMEKTDKIGRAIVHDKSRDMAREHPLHKGNAA